MSTRPLLLSILASTALACSHGGSAPQAAPASQPHPATAAPPRTAGAVPVCPMDVPGTQLSAADTATGETLTFTTTPDQVPALRERVRAMAAMHEERHATGDAAHTGHGSMHGGMGMGGMERPPPSNAAVEDVEDGARIVVTPKDPADLQKLQSTVKAHAEHMKTTGCGMMGRGAP